MSDLTLVMPELFLAVMTLVLLLLGVTGGNERTPLLTFGSILVLAMTSVFVCGQGQAGHVALAGLYVANGFTTMAKLLVLLGSALVLIMASDWISDKRHMKYEYALLVLLASLGMMVLVSSGSLLTLYMGLELMSLPLYVLAAFDRDAVKSTEAGLKYFVLGSLASGMMLFGISLVYGFSGTIDMAQLAQMFAASADATVGDAGGDVAASVQVPAGLLLGMVLMLVGFFFKVSAAPFHMWTPDVYEGAPTPVTALFAMAPKVAGLVILTRVLIGPFGDMQAYWQQILIGVSVVTMAVGAFGAIMQTNIKRLLAYSSIGHVGYALIGIAAGSAAGASGVLIYLAIYLAMSAGAFCCVLMMRRKGEYIESISDLSGLSQTRPMLAMWLAIFMFSMAGIPPLAGFFGKMYIFLAAVEAGLYWLAVAGVLASVVAAFYYLKVVKVMYFDEARPAFDANHAGGMQLVLLASGLFVLLFFLYPTPLVAYAQAAAQALAL